MQEVSETTFLPLPNMQAEMSSGAPLGIHPDSPLQVFLLKNCTHTENYAIYILNYRLPVVVYCCIKTVQICNFFSCLKRMGYLHFFELQ